MGTSSLGQREAAAPAPLHEEVLEAFLGLLDAAAGGAFERSCLAEAAAEASPMQAAAPPHEVPGSPLRRPARVTWAPSEQFLRQLFEAVGPLQAVRPRVELALRLARFHGEADAAESELRLALAAAAAVRVSRALPALLEGALLLGNYVNSSSKTLGGVVGVTLESLYKLAHTRCSTESNESTVPYLGDSDRERPASTDNALHWLVRQLQQRTPTLIDELLADLAGCAKVCDLDLEFLKSTVSKLGMLVKTAKDRCALAETSALPTVLPEAVHPTRLRCFLAEAEPMVAQLAGLLEELGTAAGALQRYLAEPPSTPLAETLRRLAALRQALPPAPGPPACPQLRPRSCTGPRPCAVGTARPRSCRRAAAAVSGGHSELRCPAAKALPPRPSLPAPCPKAACAQAPGSSTCAPLAPRQLPRPLAPPPAPSRMAATSAALAAAISTNESLAGQLPRTALPLPGCVADSPPRELAKPEAPVEPVVSRQAAIRCLPRPPRAAASNPQSPSSCIELGTPASCCGLAGLGSPASGDEHGVHQGLSELSDASALLDELDAVHAARKLAGDTALPLWSGANLAQSRIGGA